MGVTKVRPFEAGTFEARAFEVGALKVGPLQVRPVKVGPLEVGTGEPHTVEIDVAQGERTADRPLVAGKHGRNCLKVGASLGQTLRL